ncbi:MAG TPA: helix-turn-helix domain-containing GNAT family N-acetyltransferase [Chroococcales cyanobacterium]
MDHLDTLGRLALGSRMKRLSERFVDEASAIYAQHDIEFEPKWFPIFHFVSTNGSASITDIAAAVGVTHPAVNQIGGQLIEAGLLTAAAGDDRRKRMLSLTAKGQRMRARLEPVWRAMHAAVSDIMEEAGYDLVNVVAAVEKSLDRSGYLARTQRMLAVLKEKPEVVPLTPELVPHFERLNRVWIEKYFAFEDGDRKIFAHPENIVTEGGAVLFVRLGDKIVGTCALVKDGSKKLELVKMAVDEAYQGLGLGKVLLSSAIEEAKRLGARKLCLETNSVLKAAVNLYKSLGFQAVAHASSSGYSRVDTVMELDLKEKTKRKVAQA